MANAYAAGARRFVLDGFPRVAEQVTRLEELVGPLSGFVHLHADTPTLLARCARRNFGLHDAYLIERTKAFEHCLVEIMLRFSADGTRLRRVDANGTALQTWQRLRLLLLPPQVVCIVGSQGSGKSHLCRAIPTEANFLHIDVREVLLLASTKESRIGRAVRLLIENHKPWPRLLVVGLLRQAIYTGVRARKDKVVLEGFPRTIDEVVVFEGFVAPISVVIHLNTPLSVLEARIAGQGTNHDDAQLAAGRQARVSHNYIGHNYDGCDRHE